MSLDIAIKSKRQYFCITYTHAHTHTHTYTTLQTTCMFFVALLAMWFYTSSVKAFPLHKFSQPSYWYYWQQEPAPASRMACSSRMCVTNFMKTRESVRKLLATTNARIKRHNLMFNFDVESWVQLLFSRWKPAWKELNKLRTRRAEKWNWDKSIKVISMGNIMCVVWAGEMCASIAVRCLIMARSTWWPKDFCLSQISQWVIR